MDELRLDRECSEGETRDEGHDEEDVPVEEARPPTSATRHGKRRVVQARVLAADVRCKPREMGGGGGIRGSGSG